MAIFASVLTHHPQVEWRAAPQDHGFPHATHRACPRPRDAGRQSERCRPGGSHAGLS